MFDATPTPVTPTAPSRTRDVMDRWIEALESGQYEQCQQNQKNGNAYCALGLLAKVAGLQPYLGCRDALNPYEYVEIEGLLLPHGLTSDRVYNRNDRGATFPQIARWLRTRLDR